MMDQNKAVGAGGRGAACLPMEQEVVREHMIRILGLPSVDAVADAVYGLMSQPMVGYSVEESRWLWSSVMIYRDPWGIPEEVFWRARDFVNETIRREDHGAAASLLEMIGSLE